MRNFFKKKVVAEPKFVFTTRNIADNTSNGDRVRRVGGAREGDWSSSFTTIESLVASDYAIYQSGTTSGQVAVPVGTEKSTKPEDARVAAEPKNVFKEIKTEPLDISFADLPTKIKNVEERITILSEHLKPEQLMDENRALFYLKNRLKYTSTRFTRPLNWAMTTQEAVDDLCKRYKLRVVPLKQYYTLVPNEGIKEMDRYTKAYKAITGDNPIFELVIKDAAALPKEEAKQIKKKDRDPILLANSPLGNHMFILGAWDDEVEIVDEIIYSGK